MGIDISTTKRLQLYKDMYRIRHTEESLATRYKEQEMRTPAHFGIGQEAIAVGVCAALEEGDHVYSHHRCHNHYLAQGGDIHALAAELYGRETGCARGRGGSVHLTQFDKGFIASSAILGETIAVAAGSAFAFQMDKKPNIAVTFFGEAACEEGIVYETFNFASIHKLPVLFICENNGYSTESPLSSRQPEGTSLCARANAFQIRAKKVNGNDVEAVYKNVSEFIGTMRMGDGPAFLECMTYRWLEHVGPYFDHEMQRTYRSKEELEFWQARCPLNRQRERLLATAELDEEKINAIEMEINAMISDAIETARNAPWPDVNSFFNG